MTKVKKERRRPRLQYLLYHAAITGLAARRLPGSLGSPRALFCTILSLIAVLVASSFARNFLEGFRCQPLPRMCKDRFVINPIKPFPGSGIRQNCDSAVLGPGTRVSRVGAKVSREGPPLIQKPMDLCRVEALLRYRLPVKMSRTRTTVSISEPPVEEVVEKLSAWHRCCGVC